jgi:hypothetical protein
VDEKQEYEIFLAKMHELEKAAQSDDPATVLLAAGYLRHLLLDKHPLVHLANRAIGLPLRFEVGRPPERNRPQPAAPKAPDAAPRFGDNPTDRLIMGARLDGLDPDVAGAAGSDVLTLEQFLKYPITQTPTGTHTIRDVINFEANVMGAVHLGSPHDEQQRALARIARFASFGNLRSALRQLRAIARVVAKALTPLREQIEERLT